MKEGLATKRDPHKSLRGKTLCFPVGNGDQLFSGGCSGYAKLFFGSENMVVLPSTRLSATVLLSGNNVCADDIDLWC